MKNGYKLIIVLIAVFTLSGCTATKDVELVTKDQLIEKKFKEFNYDEKEAYISPDSSYVAVVKDDKIVEAFLTENNVTMHNDESGIYISNGANYKAYNDKCFIDDKEFKISSKECEDSTFGNDLKEYLESNMPDLLK